jgi:LacI family transcriptional regulator
MSDSFRSTGTPTLRQIAEESGVALATVSVALRGCAGVSKKTIAHVRKVAERMGWKPNPLVSAWLAHVRQGQSTAQYGTLAYVVNYEQGADALFRDPMLFVHRTIWKGAKEQAMRLGYDLEVFNYHDFGGPRLNKIFETRNIQGIVLASHSDQMIEMEFKWDQFSLVAVAHSSPTPEVHRASVHHFHAVSLCLERLHALGYRRIGMAIQESTNTRCRRMFVGGYFAGMHALGCTYKMNPFVPPDREFTRENFRAWLDREKPDAVMGLQFVVRDWLEELGFRIPEDIGYAHLDLPPKDELAAARKDAGIDQQLDRVGAAIIDLLTAQINRNERGIPCYPKISMVESRWIDGPTVCRQKRKSSGKTLARRNG